MSKDLDQRLPLNQIRDGERLELAGGEDERREIADRLGLQALERLEAHVAISVEKAKVRIRGRLRAAFTQACVVTGDPVAGHADEPFEILFLPQPESARPDEELELSEEECDVVFHDGTAIELGQAVVDTLALSLDPYPRSAGADAALKEAGILSESEAGPFAALAQLKRSDSNKA